VSKHDENKVEIRGCIGEVRNQPAALGSATSTVPDILTLHKLRIDSIAPRHTPSNTPRRGTEESCSYTREPVGSPHGFSRSSQLSWSRDHCDDEDEPSYNSIFSSVGSVPRRASTFSTASTRLLDQTQNLKPAGSDFHLDVSSSLKHRVSTDNAQTGRLTRLREFDMVCTHLARNLYMSGGKVAWNKDLLHENGITHIINCAYPEVPSFYPDDFVYHNISIRDSPIENISPHFFKVVELATLWTKEEKCKLLIHCSQGVSRSVSLAVALMMFTSKAGYRETLGFVQEKRPIAEPNCGFAQQLRMWESLCRPFPREQLEERQLFPKRVIIGVVPSQSVDETTQKNLLIWTCQLVLSATIEFTVSSGIH
jgi:protein-tyrosine phosphatase